MAETDEEWMLAGLRNILRRLDERPRRYTLTSLLEDVRWMVREHKRRKVRGTSQEDPPA